MRGRLFADDVECGAEISADGLYRYSLWRTWGDGPRANFVMINPSTADAGADDPTIRRCVGFARSWGYGGLVVTNLFAFRATDPRDMRAARDPVGPGNDAAIMEWAGRAEVVVCAWGCHGSYRGRDAAVCAMLDLSGVVRTAIRLSKDGKPCHPLYLPGSLTPVAFGPGARR